MRIVVDLPAPLAPRKPKISPCSTAQRDPVHGHEGPEALGQLADLDRGRRQVSLASCSGMAQRPTARSRPAAASRSEASASARASAARSWATSASSSSDDGDDALAVAVAGHLAVLARRLDAALGDARRAPARFAARARAA